MLVSFGRRFQSSVSRCTHTKQLRATRFSSTVVSVVEGGKGPELLNKTYHQLIDDQVKLYPFKDLFKSPSDDIFWDFKEALKYQDAMASGIHETSIKGGTLVTSLPLRIDQILANLASMRANFPLAVLKPGAKAPELEKQLIATQPSLLIWAPKIHNQEQLDEIYQVFPRLSTVNRMIPINDKRVPLLRQIIHTSRPMLDGMCKMGDLFVFGDHDALRRLLPKIDPKSPNIILLTPDNKEITLSQHNITNTGYLTGLQANLNEEDIVYTTLLMHNSYGLSLGLGLALTHKVKLVWGSEIFDSTKMLNALSSEYCTTIIAKPNEYKILLEDIVKQKKYFKLLKKTFVVSSPGNLPTTELLENIKNTLNTSIIVTFGINETGGVVTTTSPDTPLVTNVVGKPLPHTQIQIVDREGKPVPLDTPGQLIVKGFNITNGYRNDPALTKQKIKNGFLYTDITAKLDKDKNVVIV